jgi:two-component system invasion response regulator UvrY
MSAETDNQVDANSFAGKTLLIVDDDRGLREALSIWLGDLFPGLAIAEAGSGEEALKLFCREQGENGQKRLDEVADRKHVDAVLMDLRLPGVNGIEATRQILKNSSDVRVIILSQYSGTEFRRKAEEAGAAAYILKRQSMRELLPVIERALGAEAVVRNAAAIVQRGKR